MAESEQTQLLQVEFVSPEEVLYSGMADTVVARTRGGGDIAFLYGHEPFIGSLITSEVKVFEVDDARVEKSFVVRGGFVSVNGEKVTVLSDAAIASEDIDVAAAKVELEEAEAGLQKDPESSYLQADKKWAEVRLIAAGELTI